MHNLYKSSLGTPKEYLMSLLIARKIDELKSSLFSVMKASNCFGHSDSQTRMVLKGHKEKKIIIIVINEKFKLNAHSLREEYKNV